MASTTIHLNSLNILSNYGMPSQPNPSPSDKYRFYQCVLEPLGTTIQCKRTHDASTASNKVPSWLPSVADRAYLRGSFSVVTTETTKS